MSAGDPDFIVIGSGPNGLAAACVLGEAGARVLVLEAHPERPGGAVWSEPATLPGFVHDVGAAFFPFARASPVFRRLALEREGLGWLHATYESCHPARDGSVATIARREVRERRGEVLLGSARDDARWRGIADWHVSIERRLFEVLLGPLFALGPLFSLGLPTLARVARIMASTGRGLGRRWFESPAAHRVIPALGMHVDVGPDDRFGAGIGYVLAAAAASGGFPVARGGARSLTEALLSLLARRGGELRLGSRAVRIVIDGAGRARAVRTASGEEHALRHSVLADTSAHELLCELVERRHVPSRVVRRLERDDPSTRGTFKIDWALSGAVPWRHAEARRSAVVHIGDDVDDLARFTAEIRAGRLPDRPYVVVGQQSLADPTRAPAGSHTLWAYTRAPSRPEGGWERWREEFADVVERRLEDLAPGFRASILARRIVTPLELEAMDRNLRGGDIGGGSNAWTNQLLFRPAFPYFRYRMPVRGLYLASSYAHPGGGVHGMCGANAAERALADAGYG